MSDVKDALAAKRKKLEELKARRLQRTKMKEEKSAAPAAPASELEGNPLHFKPSVSGVEDPSKLLENVTRLLDSSGKDDPEASSAPAFSASRGPAPELSESKSEVVEIPPQEKAVYEVGIQAGETKDDDVKDEIDAEEQELRAVEERARKARADEQREQEEKLKREMHEEELKRKQLSNEDKKRLMLTPEFRTFFSRSSVLIERALYQNSRYDIAVDYSQDNEDDGARENTVLSNVVRFYEPRCHNRPVTSISWSPVHSELFLASYGNKVENDLSLDPDGLVYVWNMNLPQRPEYSFYCQSTVLTAQWHPSNAKLIIGGTSNGQVVIWDTREKSTPVNRTSLSHGHTHPLYALQAVASVNLLHNVVSVSTDGRLCVWNSDDLVEPTAQIDLTYEKQKISREVTTNSLALPSRDTNLAIMGSDEGLLYKAHIYDDPGIFEAIEAHAAPITNVQFHPVQKNAPRETADFFLTSSYDWTVKLWSSKLDRSLFTFEGAKDYVYDAQWSPVHPSVFAVGDGTGNVDFWNLNKDTEVSQHRVDALADTGSDDVKELSKRAVSRLKWSDDGKRMAVGSSSGELLVYDVAPELWKNTEEDGTKFASKMRQALTDV